MLDFLATPFLLLGSLSMWIAGLINGRTYALLEISNESEEDE